MAPARTQLLVVATLLAPRVAGEVAPLEISHAGLTVANMLARPDHRDLYHRFMGGSGDLEEDSRQNINLGESSWKDVDHEKDSWKDIDIQEPWPSTTVKEREESSQQDVDPSQYWQFFGDPAKTFPQLDLPAAGRLEGGRRVIRNQLRKTGSTWGKSGSMWGRGEVDVVVDQGAYPASMASRQVPVVSSSLLRVLDRPGQVDSLTTTSRCPVH